MKKSFVQFSLATLLFLLSVSANAQFDDPNAQQLENETLKNEIPKWVSDKGYWVIISNVKTPKESTDYFYNNEHTLVYLEEIKHRKLKLSKKTLIKLKTALEEAVASYEKGVWASRTELVKQHLE